MWKKKLYVRNNLTPHPLSRTKIDLFSECRKCFYNDLIHGVRRPHGTPLVLNNTVIKKFKDEINQYKVDQRIHPVIRNTKQNFGFLIHPKLVEFQNSFKGIRYIHKQTNFEIFGSIDDLWYNEDLKKFSIIGIKSTSKKEEIRLSDIPDQYWKQLSFYFYLLNKNAIDMSNEGILVFLNALKDSSEFNNRLKFTVNYFIKKLDTLWIENILNEIFIILQSDFSPPPSKNCKFCQYVNIINVIK